MATLELQPLMIVPLDRPQIPPLRRRPRHTVYGLREPMLSNSGQPSDTQRSLLSQHNPLPDFAGPVGGGYGR